MPLVKGEKARSKSGFADNIKTEVKEGKPKKQAVAIAYGEAKEGKKKESKKEMKHEAKKPKKKMMEVKASKTLRGVRK
jgi:fatty acid-binding protein DegV